MVKSRHRFDDPITVTKETLFTVADMECKLYMHVHVSFQSTLSTNISTVNAINSNKFFVVKKERGQGLSKRKWVIEMNEARQLYLKTYGIIDMIDSLIGHCHIYYLSVLELLAFSQESWHGMALAIVVAYDMYKECAEGMIYSDWKIDPKKVIDFYTFRDRLSTQGLEYSPVYGRYPGDEAMRVYTKLSLKDWMKVFEEEGIGPRKKVGRPSTASIMSLTSSSKDSVVTPEQFRSAKQNRAKSRLCGDFRHLSSHLKSFLQASR